MTTEGIGRKIARLKAGGSPRVLDLFAGCGGLSLGFQSTGFSIDAAVEFDPDAARSHGRNFHHGEAAHCKARDITTTHPEDLAAELELGPVADAQGAEPNERIEKREVRKEERRNVDRRKSEGKEADSRDASAFELLERLMEEKKFLALGVVVHRLSRRASGRLRDGSISSSCGLVPSARAMATRWRSPPDRAVLRRPSSGAMPSRSMAWSSAMRRCALGVRRRP